MACRLIMFSQNRKTFLKFIGKLTVAENLELSDWVFTYFDFKKFDCDIAAEHQDSLKSYGWFVFK